MDYSYSMNFNNLPVLSSEQQATCPDVFLQPGNCTTHVIMKTGEESKKVLKKNVHIRSLIRSFLMFLLSKYQTVDDADGFHIVIFTQYF